MTSIVTISLLNIIKKLTFNEISISDKKSNKNSISKEKINIPKRLPKKLAKI